MRVNLAGKVALVTGGGTGLGRAIALALARGGVAVGINYAHSETEARATAREIQTAAGRAMAVRADVADARAVQAAVAQMIAEFGRLDILVNNAGVTRFVPLADLEAVQDEDFARILAVNVTGAFLCARASAPHLRASGVGRILNIASNSAFDGAGSSIPYVVSKAGLVALTRCLARALGPTIRVDALAPGWLATRWLERYFPPEERRRILADPTTRPVALDDVADAAIELIRNDAITGQVLVVDGGETLGA